jgi:hypothetical protein
MAEQMQTVAALSNLKISAATDEGPTRFAVRVEATGLPKAPEIIKTIAPIAIQHSRAAHARMEAARRAARNRQVQPQRPEPASAKNATPSKAAR